MDFYLVLQKFTNIFIIICYYMHAFIMRVYVCIIQCMYALCIDSLGAINKILGCDD